MGKARALKLGIVKGIGRAASVALPKSWKCPICKYEFDAYQVKQQSVDSGVSPEEIVAGHIMGCIATLKGKAPCPDCGKSVSGKDFKEHMDKEHPIVN